jgi:hypothetical protein
VKFLRQIEFGMQAGKLSVKRQLFIRIDQDVKFFWVLSPIAGNKTVVTRRKLD